VIESQRMRRVGHVERLGEMRKGYVILVWRLHVEFVGLGGNIILK